LAITVSSVGKTVAVPFPGLLRIPETLVENGDGSLSCFEVALHFHFSSPLLRFRMKHARGYANQVPDVSRAVPSQERLQKWES
jgi:hypothetical protein